MKLGRALLEDLHYLVVRVALKYGSKMNEEVRLGFRRITGFQCRRDIFSEILQQKKPHYHAVPSAMVALSALHC